MSFPEHRYLTPRILFSSVLFGEPPQRQGAYSYGHRRRRRKLRQGLRRGKGRGQLHIRYHVARLRHARAHEVRDAAHHSRPFPEGQPTDDGHRPRGYRAALRARTEHERPRGHHPRHRHHARDRQGDFRHVVGTRPHHHPHHRAHWRRQAGVHAHHRCRPTVRLRLRRREAVAARHLHRHERRTPPLE